MTREQILVVEDEKDILQLVEYNLRREGFAVTGVTSGEAALRKLKKEPPALMVLDLMLPGVDGLEVCRRVKGDAATAGIPVIILTARGEETDIVAGLEMGADDYITKPFSPRVLIARVRAVLRRRDFQPPLDTEVIRIHGLVIHPGRHEVLIGDQSVSLTLTEFKVLHFLAGRPGWVFSRYQIVDAVKGEDYPVTDRSVDVTIVGLRRKLGDAGSLIETVRGVGYRFKE
jgi:two-component system phosphate regulon response regulator PhoB